MRKHFLQGVVLLFAMLATTSGLAQAQEFMTATPGSVSLSSSTPPATEGLSSISITATRTPTPEGAILLEANSTGVNVRREADIEGELLGSIGPGDLYPVTGRFFRWIEFQYDVSTRAFVYDELVTIIGDETAIRDLTIETVPTEDPGNTSATATQAVLTQTPGGVLTATAQVRILDLPGIDGVNSGDAAEGSFGNQSNVALPTFTYPPDLPPVSALQQTSTQSTDGDEGTLPPIVPIVVLTAAGLLGLTVSLTRR